MSIKMDMVAAFYYLPCLGQRTLCRSNEGAAGKYAGLPRRAEPGAFIFNFILFNNN